MMIIAAQTPATAHVGVCRRFLSLLPKLASPAMETHTLVTVCAGRERVFSYGRKYGQRFFLSKLERENT